MLCYVYVLQSLTIAINVLEGVQLVCALSNTRIVACLQEVHHKANFVASVCFILH